MAAEVGSRKVANHKEALEARPRSVMLRQASRVNRPNNLLIFEKMPLKGSLLKHCHYIKNYEVKYCEKYVVCSSKIQIQPIFDNFVRGHLAPLIYNEEDLGAIILYLGFIFFLILHIHYMDHPFHFSHYLSCLQYLSCHGFCCTSSRSVHCV